MIINCKNCNTKFLVADSLIGQDGRNVKCAKCGYIWLANLPQELNTQLSDPLILTPDSNIKYAPIAANSGLAIIRKKPPIILFILPFILFCLIIFSSLFFYNQNLSKLFPKFSGILGYFKISDTTGVVIKNLRFSKNNDESQNEVISLNYDIFNSSEDKKKIYGVKLRLLDKDKKEIISYNSKANMLLKPSDSESVSNRLSDLPKDTQYISIDLKNRFD